jgi:hypothetical protein
MKDLVILVPDKNMEAAVEGILLRHKALGIRQLDVKVIVHPARDPGCLRDGSEFLRQFCNQYAHGLILFDREGCGRESLSAEQLEGSVESQLRSSGWEERAATIVLDPELEIWVCSESTHIPRILGWETDMASLRQWLIDNCYSRPDQSKPDRPKEAMEKILRIQKKPRSSEIYSELARKVGLKHCRDRAFGKLKETLSAWFPA